MKLALVLYGQPRDYMKGYNNITAFLKGQDADVFFHTWSLSKDEQYSAALWRKIPTDDLNYKENMLSHLTALYKPVAYECEPSIKFDASPYTHTLAYKNTSTIQRLNNIPNVLSQMYSRNRARRLLLNHAGNTQYDHIIVTRFDVAFSPDILLRDLDRSKVYVSAAYVPRAIMPDNFMVVPHNIFLKWFSLYENLPTITESQELLEKVRAFSEKFEMNAEELLFAQYIYCFSHLKNVVYHPAIKPI